MDFYQMKQDVLLMDPKCIRFIEENIDFYFQRGAPTTKGVLDASFGFKKGEETLRSLLEKMSSGAVKIEDIPRIRAVNYKDCWYSLDSKRLWVLRQLGQEIPVEVIPRPAHALLRRIVRGLGDGETVQIRNPEKKGQSHEYLCKQELLKRVLIWSMKDLLTANPVNKVCTVPFRFSNVEEYMECFRRWLLEETRVQLQQNLLKSPELSCVRLIIDHNITSFGKKTFLKRLSFTVDDSFMGHKRSRGTPSKLYNPKVSDVVLLSTVEPQHVRDLLQAEALCGLAVVQGGQSGSFGSVNAFEAIIYALSHGPFYKGLSDEHRTWYALKLESLVTCQRIWESLHRPQATALAEYVATYSQPQEVEPAMSKFQDGLDDLELSVKRYCQDIRRLNDSQTEAVRSFVMGLRNRESGCCVRLIQGPPGTGKTSTLTAMLSATSCLNTRILVCAPTNTAVNEAARRFLDQRQQDLDMAQTSHFCSDLDHSEMPMGACDSDLTEMPKSSHAKPNCETLRLGDIVMLGSEDRLDVEGSVLKHILLPLRVKRLLAALSPTSGWQFQTQRFMMKLMEVSSPYACDSTLGDSGWTEIEIIGRKVIAHGETLCDDLPSPLLSSRRRNIVTKIVGTVRKLLALLSVEEFLCCEDDRPQFSPQPINQDGIKSEEAEPGNDINDDRPHPPPTHQEVIEIDDDDSPDVLPQPYEETGPEILPGTTGQSSNFEFLEAQQELLESITSEAQYPVFPNSAASSFEWLEAQCVESASLVFSTVSSAGLRFMKLGLPFSCVIVDEAAQLVEAETAIITQMEEVKQLVLVGDHKQLPATVMSQLAQQHNYGRSLFERLQFLGHPCLLLDIQYRMHPAISCFSNNQFYNHKLKNGYNVLKEAYGNAPFQRDLFGPYAFIDVSDGIEENVGSSKKNPVEAELVLHLIDRVYHSVSAEYKDFGIDDKPLSIGVITPYGGQVGFIKDRICKHPYGFKNIDSDVQIIDVEIKTVDGFQGKEKDIIIFSSVRANQAGNIGFVDDERRLNVALTRGRYAVWILGSAHTLKIHSKVWRDLIIDAKRTNSFIDATGDGGMSKVIQKFRSEYRPKSEPDCQRQGYMEIKSIRSIEALPTMMEVPRRNEWESIEQWEDDGPDWSRLSPVLRLQSEEADQYPEAGRKEMQVKRSKLSDREHQTSASFQMPTQHNLRHQRQENEDYGSPLKDRFSTSYSRRDSAFSTGRHGWGLQPENMNRSTTSKADCGGSSSIGEPSSSEQRQNREGYDQHSGSLLGVPPPDSGNTNIRHHRPNRLQFDSRPLRSHPRQTIRSREALPAMVDVSRWSECKSLGQSGDDGPDWSCLSQSCLSPVRRSPKEEAYIHQKDERESLLIRSNLSQRDYQTSSSFQSPLQQRGWHQAEGNKDYTSPLTDEFTSSYSRHEREFPSGRSGWRRQPVHMNRSSTLVADCGVCVSYGEPSTSEQKGIREDDQHPSKQLPGWGNSNSRHRRPSIPVYDSWASKSHPRHRSKSKELLPTIVEVPRWSEWDSIEQSEDDSPDWSSLSPVLRSFKEEADQFPEAHRDGLMVKCSTFSERDFQTSNSFQSATQHNASRRAQRNEDYSHRSRDRFKSCYAMPERALSSSRHGRRPQPGDMNRSPTSKANYGMYRSSSEQRRTREQFDEHQSSLRRVPYTRHHPSNRARSDSFPTRFDGNSRRRFLRKNWRDYND